MRFKMYKTGFRLLLVLQLFSFSPLRSYAAIDSVDKTSGIHNESANHSAYILGPGDTVQIELLDIPEISGTYTIGPDGVIYLPRLRSIIGSGLTIDELRTFLSREYRRFVREPVVYVRPLRYRPIRVFISGEVNLPGYYTFDEISESVDKRSESPSSLVVPTVFDAIRKAGGISTYADLSKIIVTRKKPLGDGGGRKQASLNFLSFITSGNESHNLRIFDGDTIHLSKSKYILREQLSQARVSNLSPRFIKVYVSGRVVKPGGVDLPQGSSLNQAISLAGGTRPLKGKVEYISFTQEGSIERRVFSYNSRSASGSHDNPILSSGDIVRVGDTFLSTGLSVLGEITGPFIGLYGLFSLFQ